MATFVKFEGGKELERLLLQMAADASPRIGRAAVRKAARAILVDARNRVPVAEGRLKRALRIRVDRLRNERNVISALVYVSKSGEYRPRKTNRLSRVKGKLGAAKYDYQIGTRPDVYGQFIEYGRHKQGVKARPFLRPAWDAQGGQVALVRIGDEIWAQIQKKTDMRQSSRFEQDRAALEARLPSFQRSLARSVAKRAAGS